MLPTLLVSILQSVWWIVVVLSLHTLAFCFHYMFLNIKRNPFIFPKKRERKEKQNRKRHHKRERRVHKRQHLYVIASELSFYWNRFFGPWCDVFLLNTCFLCTSNHDECKQAAKELKFILLVGLSHRRHRRRRCRFLKKGSFEATKIHHVSMLPWA